MDEAARPLCEHDIGSLALFRRLDPLLARLHDDGFGCDRAHDRRLFYDDYVRLILLYTLNPAITSLRTLQDAAGLGKVARRLGAGRFSLGSFSESAAIFDPQTLKAVVEEMGPASFAP